MASDKFHDMLKKRHDEPTVSFEEMMKELGLTYEDLRD